MKQKLGLVVLFSTLLMLSFQNCADIEGIRLPSSTMESDDSGFQLEENGPDLEAELEKASFSSVASNNEFNEQCYLARYPDVRNNWRGRPIDHWLRHGQYENRTPGCGNFVESCYLSRYPDIVNHWRRHGRITYDHWINHGISEKRKSDCDSNNPYPQQIVGSGSKPVSIEVDVLQFAGAVKSLKWNNKEFINIYDHGRQLQSALQVDGYGECNNPTEAGSANDGKGPYTSSEIVRLSKSGNNSLTTESRMAYWSFDRVTGACAKGRDTRVTRAVSDHKMKKTLVIGALNDPQIIDYQIKFTHPAGSYKEKIVYEFLTGYLNAEFKKFWYLKLNTRKAIAFTNNELVDISGSGFPAGSYQARSSAKSLYDPVIMSDVNGNYAMGVYVPPSTIQNCGSRFHSYNMYHFKLGGSGPQGNETNKWSLALEDSANSKCIINNSRSFQIYIAVGTVKEVEDRLLRLADTYK